MRRGPSSFLQVAGWLALAAAASFFMPASASAQSLFKCGATFQDRPCDNEDVQKRFSHAAGNFSIDQVNADTDKDCAAIVSRMFPLWQRMQAGDSLESVRAELEARPSNRMTKSEVRDLLLAMREFKGTPREVRSQFEKNCMNLKRRAGLPTEREREQARRAGELRNPPPRY